jgi:hypothetical protein
MRLTPGVHCGGRAMRVHLKGVHKVTVKLAGGTTATYFYAWRKGPRLVGEPGSPEFVASYYAAHQSRRESDRSRFRSIIAGYKASQDFHRLKPRTRTDYLQHIARIETEFGDLPLAALADARVTRDFLEWRDSMAHSPRQADYAPGREREGSRCTGRLSGSSGFTTPTARRRSGARKTSPPSWPKRLSRCSGR